jgi:hypothetical protein
LKHHDSASATRPRSEQLEEEANALLVEWIEPHARRDLRRAINKLRHARDVLTEAARVYAERIGEIAKAVERARVEL